MTIPVPRRRLRRLAILVPRYVRLAVCGPRRLAAVWHAIGVPRWLYHLAVPVPLRVGVPRQRHRPGGVDRIAPGLCLTPG
jgi:hypothetical protein